MATNSLRPLSTHWNDARIACVEDNYGVYDAVTYYASKQAVQGFGARQVARFLAAVGYCALSTEGCIARLDLSAWLAKGRKINLAIFDSRVHGTAQKADYYREHISRDRICRVPSDVMAWMPGSDNNQEEVNIRYKGNITDRIKQLPDYTRPQPAEDFPMIDTTTEETTTALTLDPLPMKVVVVTFPDREDKEFHYFAPESAKPGDFCVVYATANPRQACSLPFVVGTIVRETPDLEGRARAAILGTFNEAFAKHVQARMDMLSTIKAKLQQKKKQFEDTQFFEMMAQSDPEARELLDQLKQFRV